ncbi:DUF927 domain-containing protein [Brevundimonas sp. SL161]|uniref:DUF927 domain-containing protein n=1 Tax=Brevundimonas sp. SL161 TaxID=2804613 RepID=UPI003CE9ECAE
MNVIKTPEIRGIIDQHGHRKIWVVASLGETFLTMPEVAEPNKTSAKLAEIGYVLVPGKQRNEFFAKMAAVQEFSKQHIVDTTGHHQGRYALGDGTQIVPPGLAHLPSAMLVDQDKWTSEGTLKAWRKGVAKPLSDQSIPMFVVMLAFAPPLMRLMPPWTNPGFELVGRGGTGKSTLLKLASSVYGGTGGASGDGKRYWESWNVTVAGVETRLPGHTDCLLLLDELNALSGGGTTAAKRKSYNDILFSLADGIERGRHREKRGRQHSLCYLSTSNTSLVQELCGGDAEVVRAASDRLLTINANAGAGLGVFSSLPTGFASSGELVESLKEAANANHGVAIRAYLQALVNEMDADTDALTERLGEWSRTFERRALPPAPTGSQVRTASNFGLVYAAGKLAQAYGVLPKEWSCGPAVLACYEAHMLHKSMAFGRPEERIRAYAAQPDVLSTLPSSLTQDQLRASAGLLVRERKYDELWVSPEVFADRMADAVALMKQLRDIDLAICDPGQLQTTRPIAGRQRRLYCFRFPHK